jgi:hypothetical protein
LLLQLIYRVDSSLPPAEAAAILGSYATAYASLVRYARINSGLVFDDHQLRLISLGISDFSPLFLTLFAVIAVSCCGCYDYECCTGRTWSRNLLLVSGWFADLLLIQFARIALLFVSGYLIYSFQLLEVS